MSDNEGAEKSLEQQRAELMERRRLHEERTKGTNERHTEKMIKKIRKRVREACYVEQVFRKETIECRRDDEYIMQRQRILIPDVLTTKIVSNHKRQTGIDYHITVSGYEGYLLEFSLDVEGRMPYKQSYSNESRFRQIVPDYFADGKDNFVSFQNISRLHPLVKKCLVYITHRDPSFLRNTRFPGNFFSGKGIYSISNGENPDEVGAEIPISGPDSLVIDSGDVARFGYNANVIVVGLMEKIGRNWYYSAADIGFFFRDFYMGDATRFERRTRIDVMAEKHLYKFFHGDLDTHFQVLKQFSEEEVIIHNLPNYLGIHYDGEKNVMTFDALTPKEEKNISQPVPQQDKIEEKIISQSVPQQDKITVVPQTSNPEINKKNTKSEKAKTKKNDKPEPKKNKMKKFFKKKKGKKLNVSEDLSDDVDLNVDELNLDELNLDDLNLDDLNLDDLNLDDLNLDDLNLDELNLDDINIDDLDLSFGI